MRQQGGIFVHGQERVVVGDGVEALRMVQGIIPKGTRLRVMALITGPRDTVRGFEGRLKFMEFPDEDFNAKRFRKVPLDTSEGKGLAMKATEP